MSENIQKYVIPEFPDFTVDENGTFVNEVTGHILKLSKMASESVKVNFRVGNQVYSRSAARIVCTMFHGEPERDDYIPNYKDGNYLNIAASNLEWQTRWYVAEYRTQLNRTEPIIDEPIIKLKTGEIWPNSRTASIATGVIEKYIALAVMEYDVQFAGSQWDYHLHRRKM